MTTTQTTVDLLPRRLAPLRKLIVGVDGGGTRTRAAILDGDRILGEGTSGPSNPLRVGIANGAAAIREAIDKACSAALIDRDDLVAAGIGLAGVRRKDIRARMRDVLIETLEIKNIDHSVLINVTCRIQEPVNLQLIGLRYDIDSPISNNR